MEAGMRKIKKATANLDRNLDPDFGNQSLDAVEAFFVVVTPEVKNIKVLTDYIFVVLLPETGSQEEANELLSAVLEEVLDPGDRYTVRRYTHEDYENSGADLPILAFHPDHDGDFFWLRPPRHLMH
jgi:hypothetical protein